MDDMRYLILLNADESAATQPGDPGWDAEMAAYEAFGELAGEAIVGGEALQPLATCRTIRHDGGSVRVTDGPFAEGPEGLGGYYVLEAPTLDDALELARHIPAAASGGVEVRPLVEWTEKEASAARDADRYFATIHGPETADEIPGSAEWDAGAEEHAMFAKQAGDAVLAAGAVHPAASASVVRVREGELRVTDGPYAEGSEVVGGVYLLRGDADDVLALAKLIPVPSGGAVTLYPILELGG